MGTVLWNIWFYGLWWIDILTNGFFLYRLCRPFVMFRKGGLWKAVFLLTLAFSSGMVIWIGDPNLLYTLPIYFLLFFLCTRGDWVGRLTVCVVFFCLEMSVCALVDTYVQAVDTDRLYDLLVRLLRTAIFGAFWLLLRRRFPAEQVHLTRRLWQVVLGLASMPLCALIAVVLLTFQKYESAAVNTLALNQGLLVLPFVLVTSLVLLVAILILADHERLERASQLAGLREVYYQGLQQQERQVRQLRHDMRNHLTVVQGLLERGDTQGAVGYLEQMAGSQALQGVRRFCENESANVVLSAKAEAMEQAGITADFAVSLPKDLPVADTDLVALLGNALDNAIEGVQNAAVKKITLRCRVD
ncbi:sensor histidine kinase [uncultured Oscillibacter sp.]|uniref:sensor histidine kinase n=1 Tax=uncultured Oscillibacter sp. TaxID=876091 RepID=UPI0035A6B762